MPRLFRILLWDHPLFWFGLGMLVMMRLSSLPTNSWNVEILIARNILDGFGFVVAPLDPPALWRPPLAVALLLPIQVLFHDPRTIYAVFGSLTLVGFMVSVFYLMKNLGGNVAAHFSQLFILTTPAFTALVGHQLQMMSYLLLFSLVTVSILATLRSWQKTGWKRDALAGFCWGMAFLARPEALLLFAASLFAGMAFHRSLSRFVRQMAAFLLIYVPCVWIFSALQTRHNLVGQEALITFYAGERLADNQMTGDPDADGYAASVVQFGTPEKYHNSLIRFAVAHPDALLARIRKNLSSFIKLIRSHQIFNLWDCLVFLLFGSILVFASPPSLPLRPRIGFMTLLVLASPYFLLFHVDVRYSLLFALAMTLWLLVVALAVWTWIGPRVRHGRHWWIFLSTVILVILCAYKLGHNIRIARTQSVDLKPWSQLAESFRAEVGSSGTPVVGYFQPNGEPLTGGDFLWFSYFARTAVPWCGSPTCEADRAFPRDRIYSFQGKSAEYLWIPDDPVETLAAPNAHVISHLASITGMGAYALIQVAPTPNQ